VDSLLRLVGDMAMLETHWESQPFVSKGLGNFDDVFSVDLADRLIHSGMPVAAVRLFRDGTALPAEALAKPRERAGRGREYVVDGAKVAEHVLAGATVVLEELQTYSTGVAAFAAHVTEATGYATYCAAFLTPAGSRGVAPHYDMASVFIRQVEGSKRWRVSAPQRKWPNREWSARMNLDTELLLDVVLDEDDCLYIPRGFVHVGDATEGASAHLSIALRPVTWDSVLRNRLTRAMAECEPLREALPPRFSSVDRAQLYRERLAMLASYLTTLDCPDESLPTFEAPVPQTLYSPGSLNRALDRRGVPSDGDG
jgi:bifunctional lysine-specific demethylase and histidyl-hydroxylase NO66